MAVVCPLCKAPLEPCGELSIDDAVLSVYQCDRCTRPWDLGDGGEPLQIALTFAVDSDGRLFDPETLEPFSLDPPSPN